MLTAFPRLCVNSSGFEAFLAPADRCERLTRFADCAGLRGGGQQGTQRLRLLLHRTRLTDGRCSAL